LEYSRNDIALLIIERLELEKNELTQQFERSKDKIGFFVLDNVLSDKLAMKIFENFPEIEESTQKKSLREHKYVAFQMDKYHAILEEVIYAFQDKRIVKIIKEICSLRSIFPDEHLYAGGLSMMKKGNFLNPHLDNSHDKDRKNKRVLNLLYYVTPNWQELYGGNLEIWPDGLKRNPVTILSRFNRLVVMETHKNSWHSVNKVRYDGIRCCVSNYYFSDNIEEKNDFHVTSFRGRPSQKLRNVVLKIDTLLRTNIRKIFKKGITENTHKYRRKNN